MDELQTIDIQRVKALAPIVDEYGIGNDFIIGEVSGKRIEKNEAILAMLRYPVRFDGYIVFFCRSGHFQLDVNLNTYDIHEHSLLINVPGNIIKIGAYKEDHIGDAEIYFVLISKEFLSNIRFDFNKVFQDSMRIMDNPCITLNEAQLDVAEDYFKLARKIIGSDLRNKREIIGSLLTSLTYMAVDVWAVQLTEAQQRKGTASARINQVFERFISLVTEYHTSQRGMAFYADKLCLTPKYLSKLIKQASGRSAPDWIDSFVILEAKNMLKYSDMTIKEIVYQLHFPNQSVFYKFFKAHTGLTPSEYRNG
ncbi:MAG: AraC family transcriptional regulator [Bacteroidales bacterium]|nr:AraC family transcriptional regulator [Bacteroidales bacterium]